MCITFIYSTIKKEQYFPANLNLSTNIHEFVKNDDFQLIIFIFGVM